jgi:alpha-glucuronidase
MSNLITNGMVHWHELDCIYLQHWYQFHFGNQDATVTEVVNMLMHNIPALERMPYGHTYNGQLELQSLNALLDQLMLA